jgi:hypothetical protein
MACINGAAVKTAASTLERQRQGVLSVPCFMVVSLAGLQPLPQFLLTFFFFFLLFLLLLLSLLLPLVVVAAAALLLPSCADAAAIAAVAGQGQGSQGFVPHELQLDDLIEHFGVGPAGRGVVAGLAVPGEEAELLTSHLGFRQPLAAPGTGQAEAPGSEIRGFPGSGTNVILQGLGQILPVAAFFTETV